MSVIYRPGKHRHGGGDGGYFDKYGGTLFGGVQREQTLPVDLHLAQTYVPAFSCLVRGGLLIILISREWAQNSVPLLMALGIILYMDRVIRSESIFDSNSLLGSILVIHSLNMFRADPHTHYFYFSLVDPKTKEVSTDQIGIAAHVVYYILTVTLVGGYDIVTIMTHGCRVNTNGYGLTHVKGHARGVTILVHGFLIGCVLQTPLAREAVNPSNTLFRCFLFLLLCMAWCYVVGVQNMVRLLVSTTRVPSLNMTWSKGGKKSKVNSTIVQSFIPCQLRFLVVLLCANWAFYPITGLLVMIMIYKTYRLNHGSGDVQGAEGNTLEDHGLSIHPEYYTVNSSDCLVMCDMQEQVPEMFVSHESDMDAVQGVGSTSIKPTRVVSGDVILGQHSGTASMYSSGSTQCQYQQGHQQQAVFQEEAISVEMQHHPTVAAPQGVEYESPVSVPDVQVYHQHQQQQLPHALISNDLQLLYQQQQQKQQQQQQQQGIFPMEARVPGFPQPKVLTHEVPKEQLYAPTEGTSVVPQTDEGGVSDLELFRMAQFESQKRMTHRQ